MTLGHPYQVHIKIYCSLFLNVKLTAAITRHVLSNQTRYTVNNISKYVVKIVYESYKILQTVVYFFETSDCDAVGVTFNLI